MACMDVDESAKALRSATAAAAVLAFTLVLTQ